MVVTGAFASMGNSSSDRQLELMPREALSWQVTRHPSVHRAWRRKSRLPGAVYLRFEIVTRHSVARRPIRQPVLADASKDREQ
jgi:hypothetical protein